MTGFLVDTNVISEFIKPQPDSLVIRWLEAADPQSLFASVITFGEIRLGIEDLPAGKRRTELEEWLDQGLPEWFEANLLPVTKAIVDRWGRLTIRAKRKGVTITTADGLIAATALEHDLAVATRNIAEPKCLFCQQSCQHEVPSHMFQAVARVPGCFPSS